MNSAKGTNPLHFHLKTCKDLLISTTIFRIMGLFLYKDLIKNIIESDFHCLKFTIGRGLGR